MQLGLDGKRAAIAGATGGLGLACARSLAAEGVRVAVCGRDEAKVRDAVAQLGRDAVGLVADLANPLECERFVVEAGERLSGLDILVTNGPGPKTGNFAESDPGDYQSALELNLLSVVRMCYAAVPQMQQQGWGRVVAITSLAVRQPIANLILSNTARAGATGFLKTLAREVAGDGVTVNSVQPGLHGTDRIRTVYGDSLEREIETIPAGTVGRPEDLGSLVAFLCSAQARFITGASIPVDGGQDRALL